MEWIYLLIAYLPIVCVLAGIVSLIAGLCLRKRNRTVSTVLFVAGGVLLGIWLLIYGVFFLIGALGLGPVPAR